MGTNGDQKRRLPSASLALPPCVLHLSFYNSPRHFFFEWRCASDWHKDHLQKNKTSFRSPCPSRMMRLSSSKLLFRSVLPVVRGGSSGTSARARRSERGNDGCASHFSCFCAS